MGVGGLATTVAENGLGGAELAATTLEGVFAAGDIVRGASLVVWAVRDGQDAAAEIDAWLASRRTVAA